MPPSREPSCPLRGRARSSPIPSSCARPERFWLETQGVERLLAGGDRCLAIRDGEEIVYRATVMSDPARVAQVLEPRGLAEPAWIVSGVLTHPAHRGRRLHATAMAWLGGEARRAGARRIVAWIAEWNRSAQRAFARAGFRPVGEHPPGASER